MTSSGGSSGSSSSSFKALQLRAEVLGFGAFFLRKGFFFSEGIRMTVTTTIIITIITIMYYTIGIRDGPVNFYVSPSHCAVVVRGREMFAWLPRDSCPWHRSGCPTQRLLSVPFILNVNHKRELLRSLWVQPKP